MTLPIWAKIIALIGAIGACGLAFMALRGRLSLDRLHRKWEGKPSALDKATWKCFAECYSAGYRRGHEEGFRACAEQLGANVVMKEDDDTQKENIH